MKLKCVNLNALNTASFAESHLFFRAYSPNLAEQKNTYEFCSFQKKQEIVGLETKETLEVFSDEDE